MVHQDYLLRVGELAMLVWGSFGDPMPWFASRLGIHAFCTRGGVTLFELFGDDAKLFHAPEALRREVSILVVEAQEFSYCIVCSDFLLLRLKC